jgi:hypothetical protein
VLDAHRLDDERSGHLHSEMSVPRPLARTRALSGAR